MSLSASSDPRWITEPALITKSNRGPMTTAFSAPASCTDTFTFDESRSRLYLGHYYNKNVDPTCYPTGTIPAGELVTGPSWSMYYYSPAVCPQGWTIATTFERSFLGSDVSMPLGSETTAGLCCPSNYGYQNYGHVCGSKITPNQVMQYIVPTMNGTQFTNGLAITTTLTTWGRMQGDGVPIWWQSTDRKSSPAVATPSSSTTSTSNAQTSQTSSLPSNTQTPPSDSDTPSGLSSGAKAGIGVGVAAFLLLVALTVGMFVFVRRKKRVAESESVEELGSTTVQEKAWDPLYEMPQPDLHHTRHELEISNAR